jgi:diguanylate cyclase (GGDEF)-like protein
MMSAVQPRSLFASADSAGRQLRRRFWIAIALVIACSLALGASLIANRQQQAVAAGDALQRLSDLRIVLHAANRISAERGPSNAVLGEPPASDSPALARLRQFRANSDDALKQVAGISGVSQAAEAPAMLLASARSAIDALAARPVEARGEQEIQRVIEAMFRAHDSTQDLVDTAITTLFKDYGTGLVGRALVARMLSELREYAGRLGSHLIPAIARQQPLSLERRAAFEATRGRVLELWLLIRQQTSINLDPAVAAAHQAVIERFFDDGMALLGRMVQAGETGRYGTTPTDFTRDIVATFAPLEQLRDAFLTNEIAQLEGAYARAKRSLWIVSAGTAGLILVELLLLMLSQRLLFQPLLEARSRVIALADGDVAEPARHSAAKGEMRALFDSLEVLRQRLIERNALDRERAALTRSLRRQADMDGLTGIMNRGALDRMAAELPEDSGAGAQIGLILLDIDHFKLINDSFGHAAGDEVLKEIARRLSEGIRPGDAVARFGGEEFAILIRDVRGNAPYLVAERLRLALASRALSVGPGELVPVTASFGIAVSANQPGSWPDLVASADRALYAAKAGGRNRVIDNGMAA